MMRDKLHIAPGRGGRRRATLERPPPRGRRRATLAGPAVRAATLAITLAITLAALACDGGEGGITPPDPSPDPPANPPPEVYTIPIVVHVIHNGEPVGEGPNLSVERIESQIRVLNEDFRRKPGTRGHNTHPDGGDARIEFVLARVAPDGSPTDGIHRVDASTTPNPVPLNNIFDYYAHYGYWDPERYVNVWTLPLNESTIDAFFGMATGPETDLPGADRLARGEPVQAEGILVNPWHFGESSIDSDYNLGRTLTHEMGHYLGLLHTWGTGECETNDYCADTPAVDSPVTSCADPPPTGCDGEPVMVENYMNFTTDACMNTFTRDQIARMRYVLATSPRRKALPASPGLGEG